LVSDAQTVKYSIGKKPNKKNSSKVFVTCFSLQLIYYTRSCDVLENCSHCIYLQWLQTCRRGTITRIFMKINSTWYNLYFFKSKRKAIKQFNVMQFRLFVETINCIVPKTRFTVISTYMWSTRWYPTDIGIRITHGPRTFLIISIWKL